MKNYSKMMTTLLATGALALGVSACTTYDKDECHVASNDKGMAHSKQWSKEKQQYCAEQHAKDEHDHLHEQGIYHTHEGYYEHSEGQLHDPDEFEDPVVQAHPGHSHVHY